MQLSSAFAKALGRLCYGQLPLVPNVADALVDIVGARIAAWPQRRAAARWLESCGDRVAIELESYLEAEFGGLPSNERAAATTAVAHALATVKLTRPFLLEINADLSKLEECISENVSDEYLVPAAVQYQSLLIRDVATYLHACAIEEPNFGAYAVAELLRREDSNARRLEDAISRVPQHVAALVLQDESPRFEVEYRRFVARASQNLTLIGAEPRSRRFPLSVAYLSLLATDAKAPQAEAERVHAVLARHSRLLIRGEAGSGKTTLLQWLTVRTALQDHPIGLSTWNSLVPMMVQLRRFADDPDLPAPDDLLKHTVPHLPLAPPDRWLIRTMTNGRALVLLDGLDELPPRLARQADAWLVDLCENYPDATYVIASRPKTASSINVASAGFSTCTLEPMGDPDVKQFVAHWHNAVASRIDERDELIELRRHESKLLTHLESSRELRTLAKNPLLCALVCALNREFMGHVPQNRLAVYASALRTLAVDRNIRRDIPHADALDFNSIVRLLQDVAYWMARNDRKVVDVDLFVDRLTQRLPSMPHVTLHAKACANYLIQRSGLLREPSEGSVDFLHSTFQEFLAAREIVDQDDLGLLKTRSRTQQWDQISVFVAGLGSERQRVELLEHLLYDPPREGEDVRTLEQRRQGVILTPTERRRALRRGGSEWLALECLEVSVALEQELVEEIRSRTAAMMPPASTYEARLIAAAGPAAEAALCALEPGAASETQARAVLAALEIVASKDALLAMAKWATDTRPGVRQAAVNAWSAFDTEPFARQVLATLPPYMAAGVTLTITTAEQARAIGNLIAFTDLAIRPWARDIDLKVLAIDERRMITTYDTSPHSWELLRTSHGLRKLSVHGLVDVIEARFRDESALLTLSLSRSDCLALVAAPRLVQSLALDACPNLTRITVDNGTRLRQMRVTGCGAVSIDPLPDGGTHLQSLSLGGTCVADFDWLPTPDQLTQLEVGEVSTATPAQSLLAAEQLKTLTVLGSASVRSLDWMPSHQSLTCVRLQSLPNCDDVSALMRLEALEVLELNNLPRLRELPELGQLPRLRNVVVRGCSLGLNFGVLEGVEEIDLPFPP